MENNKGENKYEYLVVDVYGGRRDPFTEGYGTFRTEKEATDYIKNTLIPEYGYNGFYPVKVK